MSVTSDIRPLLTAEWQSAREIWQALDCWTALGVRNALHRMAVDGTVEKLAVRQPGGGIVQKYRLKPNA